MSRIKVNIACQFKVFRVWKCPPKNQPWSSSFIIFIGFYKLKLEDEETVAIRRERNRIAAQRCRQRRRDRIEKLEKVRYLLVANLTIFLKIFTPCNFHYMPCFCHSVWFSRKVRDRLPLSILKLSELIITSVSTEMIRKP